MKNILMLIMVFLMSVGSIYADVGTFDIIEIDFDGNTFYTSQHEFYYYHQYVFDDDIYARLEVSIESDSIVLWKQYKTIDISKFEKGEMFIHVLEDEIKFHKNDFVCHYQIKNVTRGNSAGFIYTAELIDLDNIWINDYEIEKIFVIESDLCHLQFFAIKHNLDMEEKETLRKKLQRIIKNDDEFQKVLKELYLQNIIMIGSCSGC